MGKKKNREPGHGGSARGDGPDRWEEKRRRFTDDRDQEARSRGLKPTTLITLGAIALAVVIVAVVFLQGGGAGTAQAAVLQQVPTSAATVEGGKVSVPVDEVKAKKIVYWDYEKNGKKVPLMAFVTPSGAVKLAVRICEPCNGFSFRIEGNQVVCNVCGTRWDLETLKGISGGCQGYPPDVLPSSVADGKISVDEAAVTSWKARV